MGFPCGLAGKESTCNVRPGFDPWVGKIPWKRESLPTPVFWPREFMDQTRLSKFHFHWSEYFYGAKLAFWRTSLHYNNFCFHLRASASSYLFSFQIASWQPCKRFSAFLAFQDTPDFLSVMWWPLYSLLP